MESVSSFFTWIFSSSEEAQWANQRRRRISNAEGRPIKGDVIDWPIRALLLWPNYLEMDALLWMVSTTQVHFSGAIGNCHTPRLLHIVIYLWWWLLLSTAGLLACLYFKLGHEADDLYEGHVTARSPDWAQWTAARLILLGNDESCASGCEVICCFFLLLFLYTRQQKKFQKPKMVTITLYALPARTPTCNLLWCSQYCKLFSIILIYLNCSNVVAQCLLGVMILCMGLAAKVGWGSFSK